MEEILKLNRNRRKRKVLPRYKHEISQYKIDTGDFDNTLLKIVKVSDQCIAENIIANRRANELQQTEQKEKTKSKKFEDSKLNADNFFKSTCGELDKLNQKYNGEELGCKKLLDQANRKMAELMRTIDRLNEECIL